MVDDDREPSSEELEAGAKIYDTVLGKYRVVPRKVPPKSKKMRHIMIYKARIYVPDCNEDKMEKIYTALDELLMDFEIRCFIEDELKKKPEFEGSEVTVDWE